MTEPPAPPSSEPPPPPRSGFPDDYLPADRVGSGAAYAVLLTVVFQILLAAVTGGLALLAWGVTQISYMLPVWLLLRGRWQRPLAAKGLAIVAGVILLLNVACTGVVFLMMSGASFH